MPLPKYVSHKEVEAAKIKAIDTAGNITLFSFEGEDVPQIAVGAEELLHRPVPEVGMYLMIYNDGYVSFSPAEAFESGYTLKA